MTSYLYRAPAGIAGSITRAGETTVEPGMLDAAAGTPTAFGQPLKVVAGKFRLMGAGSVAADFYGVLSRFTPSISGGLDESFVGGSPNAGSLQGIVTRGYLNAICGVGTPVRGGAVYVRIVDGGAGKPVGQYEADADGANSVLVPVLVWATDGKDSANNAELRVAR